MVALNIILEHRIRLFLGHVTEAIEFTRRARREPRGILSGLGNAIGGRLGPAKHFLVESFDRRFSSGWREAQYFAPRH